MKRKYEYRVKKRLAERKKFLVEHLGREWDAIERGARREELVQKAKVSGAAAARTLLALLLVGGVVTVAAVAPNVFAAVGRIAGRKGFFHKKSFHDASRYLHDKRYIVTEKHDDMYKVRLTKTGADIILQRSLSDMKIAQEEKWDGMWHMVMFDIPNRHKWARDALRGRLNAMGFYRIQESVFVFPYPCEKEIAFLTDLFSVSQYVRIASVKNISEDKDLREYFDLRV